LLLRRKSFQRTHNSVQVACQLIGTSEENERWSS
jgi:hypothetical protein